MWHKDWIKIICRDEAELGKVKRVLETKTEPGTRILRDQLFPVKVDNVNRTAILDEEGKARHGIEAALGRENGVQIAKIVWLSNRDNGKAYGSMAWPSWWRKTVTLRSWSVSCILQRQVNQRVHRPTSTDWSRRNATIAKKSAIRLFNAKAPRDAQGA